MIHERINLTEDGRVYMMTYIHDISDEKPSVVEPWRWQLRPKDAWQIPKRPAVIVCPGGGYFLLSDREAEPVALAFMREGFDTFVLYYSIGDYSAYPAPLEDALKAIWTVRSNAEKWGIDPDAISVMGFSAGGHLSGLVSTQWNSGIEERLNIPKGGAKPNAAVIGYAPAEIINAGTVKKDGKMSSEPGKMISEAPDEFNFYKYINAGTPPMFIWHTLNDPLCPSSNALKLATACAENKIPYELHIFARGTHGMSLCDDLTDYEAPIDVRPENAKLWVKMCTQWLKELFGLVP